MGGKCCIWIRNYVAPLAMVTLGNGESASSKEGPHGREVQWSTHQDVLPTPVKGFCTRLYLPHPIIIHILLCFTKAKIGYINSHQALA